MSSLAPDDEREDVVFERELRLAAGELDADLELVHLARVESTNSWALDREQRAESRNAVLVIADEQSAGRGQHGRSWFAAAGGSLALSYVPRPHQRELDAPRLSMAAAVAAREALAGVLPRAPRLKWPNDLLVASRKIAGILVESRCIGARRVGPVLGIGVNLGVAQEEFPLSLRELATSVALAGGRVPRRATFAGTLARGFDRWLERARSADGRELAEAYLAGLELLDREVEVATGAGIRRGICVGLDLEHGLHLREDGLRSAWPLAQIAALREAGPAADLAGG